MVSAVSFSSQLIVPRPARSLALPIFAAPKLAKSPRICANSALDLLSLPLGGRNESRTQGTGQPRQYHEICEGGTEKGEGWRFCPVVRPSNSRIRADYET